MLIKDIGPSGWIWRQGAGQTFGRGHATIVGDSKTVGWLWKMGASSEEVPWRNFPGIADWNGLEVLEAAGRCVLPAWVDSHTHLVHAAAREGEFVDRIRGLSYQEIAANGGGILNSAKALQGHVRRRPIRGFS